METSKSKVMLRFNKVNMAILTNKLVVFNCLSTLCFSVTKKY
ncbi:hypothetical protein yrohd0001_28550 [Yersinia rohdei ATCC 43380]|nr:hypothetical protein yrohd0001_28550 [Yersinia rohdei ATCC 43380]